MLRFIPSHIIIPSDAYASVKWTTKCSGIGLSLSWCQAIIRTDVDLQLIQDYTYIYAYNSIKRHWLYISQQ